MSGKQGDGNLKGAENILKGAAYVVQEESNGRESFILTLKCIVGLTKAAFLPPDRLAAAGENENMEYHIGIKDRIKSDGLDGRVDDEHRPLIYMRLALP